MSSDLLRDLTRSRADQLRAFADFLRARPAPPDDSLPLLVTGFELVPEPRAPRRARPWVLAATLLLLAGGAGLGSRLDLVPPPPAAIPLVAPVPVVTAAPALQTITVRPGDSLSLIAARLLGREDDWPRIAAANPGIDPDRLEVGAELRVPAAPSPAP